MGRHWSEAFKRVTEADLIERDIELSRAIRKPIEKAISEMARRYAEIVDERIFNLLMRKLNPMRGQL